MNISSRVYRYRKKYLENYSLGKIKADQNNPQTKFWLSWKIIIFIIDNYYINQCFLWITFYSFYIESIRLLLPLNIIFMIFLAIDRIFHFMMSPTIPGQIFEQNSKLKLTKLIMKHFFVNSFFGIGTLLYFLFLISFFVPYEGAKYLHLIYFLKIVQVSQRSQEIYRRFHTSKTFRVSYTLLKMVYVIVLISHILACIFYLIDQTLIENQTFGDPNLNPNNYYQYTSISFTPIEMLSEFQRYIEAIYFTSGLITTIAYGDIVGKNYIQDAFVIVLLVATTIVIALILEQLMIMVGDNSFAIFQIIKKYKNIEQYMKAKNVNAQVQNKVRNFLFYAQYENQFHNYNDTLEKLSEKLRLDLFEEGYVSLFGTVLVGLGFQDTRSVCSMLSEVTFQAESEIYYPHYDFSILSDQEQKEIVALRGTNNHQMNFADFLYVISGKVMQYAQKNYNTERFIIKNKHRHYNLYEYVTNQRVRFGLRTKKLTKVVKLEKDCLKSYLDQNQIVKKKMITTREQILCGEITRKICEDSCLLCEEEDHSLEYCPQAHYVISENISKAIKISDILRKLEHQRTKYSYKQRKTIKSNKVKGLNYTNFSQIFHIIGEKAVGNEPSTQKQISHIFIENAIKNILNFTRAFINTSVSTNDADCCYDPEGISQYFSLREQSEILN